MHMTRLHSASIAVTELNSMQSFSSKLRKFDIVSHYRSFSSQRTLLADFSERKFSRFVQLPKDRDWLENLKDFLFLNALLLQFLDLQFRS